MKTLKSGAVIAIPLLSNLGYAFAKYIDVQKLDSKVSYPDILKVYSIRSSSEVVDFDLLTSLLISPILVAGLRPSLKQGFWKIVGKKELNNEDSIIPNFFRGNSTDSDIPNGTWFKINSCKTNNREKVSYEEIKHLQHYTGHGTGNIEILLTMYFMLKESIRVEEFFDLADFNNNRLYKQVLDANLLT
ncbi:Imm26 family immunity protein [Acidiluteibacter ferrifornacis]|uniref:Uncharacterized protein n=1 Tax=Acidiluteibacter ferrifornacis TaxID=2692424 RepID=A0A6N9NJD7_9FLAO|nr:Imm26 family immunity protein [Acidiluteibacter ferrifornacis]NBG64765.1 hypothetical protein [Acidiluteibacter ferrifornacis]